MPSKGKRRFYTNRFDRYKNDLALHVLTQCGKSLYFHQDENILIYQGSTGFGHGFTEYPAIVFDRCSCGCDLLWSEDDHGYEAEAGIVSGTRFKLGWSFEVLHQRTFVFKVQPSRDNFNRNYWKAPSLRRTPPLLTCERSEVIKDWFSRGSNLKTTIRKRPRSPDTENRMLLMDFHNREYERDNAKRLLIEEKKRKLQYRQIEL